MTKLKTLEAVSRPAKPGSRGGAAPSVSAAGRLTAAFDHAGVGIAEIDGEGTLLRVNAHLCELTGYSSQELLGSSIFAGTHPEDVDTDREQLRRQRAGEIDRYSVEKRIRRKAGGYFWAAVTSSSVRDAKGRFLHAVRVQHDITAGRQAQEALARRIEEQTALHQLTERLQHALSLDDLHGPALDAIIRALRCQRAAILLFDKSGAMRFVASRGLSEDYRRAVDGHSPWAPDARSPQPICLDDVRGSDLPAVLQQAVAAEGIGAIAFIPIQDGGRLLGKFMAYYDGPHAFSAMEIDLAVAIARQLGFGIQRIGAERAALQLASIVESSDDAIVSKDLDGNITTWNRGAERLFGYSAEEAVGKPILILIPPDRVDEEPGILARIRNGERIDHFETVRRRKDGSLIDISLTVSPMRDNQGRIVGASKIARDITERRVAEAKLRQSEHHLRELLGAVPAAIYTTDADGRITYYNQGAVDLAGRTPTLGSDEWCVTWKMYRPDGAPLPHDECPMAIALREGRPIRNVEAIAERPDGTRVPFIPYPTPLRDEAGRIVGAINMLVDVSERKQAESQQRMLLDELNHRVKNNLQMLQSLLFTASQRTQNGEARRALDEAGARIAAVAAAQRVLYSTRNATRFDTREFVDAVCESARQTFPPDVEIRREADPAELSNDVAMPLALILNELLTNAVKHGMPTEARGTIRVELRRQTDSFVLSVEDDGPGFDPGSASARSSGLQLVRGLARQLRGQFVVSTQPVTRCSLQFPAGDPC
jgi:PAS domain S-box-containing protein